VTAIADDERFDPLEHATELTREAEERFVETPLGSPELVPRAETVEQRAEEIRELAHDDHPDDADTFRV
jgi:hypothetical protein